jgi:hypothetical protein
MRVQITLYGDDARWFLDLQEQIAEQRDGTEPANAEVARLMMEQFDAGGRIRQ